MAAGLLFLRSGILRSLRRNIHDTEMLEETLSFYGGTQRLAIRAVNSTVAALPLAFRAEIFSRMARAAQESGIGLSVCACKNPDLASGTCGIGGTWPMRSGQGTQSRLFA